MAVSTVLFDLGGVIVDSPLHAFDAYEREAGLPEGIIRRVNSTNPDSNAWARLERGELDADGFVPVFEAEARALGVTLDARRVLAALSGAVRPVMVEAVRRLRSGGLRLALLTNNHAPIPREGELGELLNLFDAVVESSVEGVRKPEPEFYARALARVGSPPPDECVFLDDLGVNLKPARALGMTTIKVTVPAQALQELAAVTGVDVTGVDATGAGGAGTAATAAS